MTPAAATAPGAPPDVLAVAGLRKTYGSTVAVEDVSFCVRRNEIVGLLGPNGAGRTTTIKLLLGVLAPTRGTIHVAGVDLAARRSQAFERANFAAVVHPARVLGLRACSGTRCARG